MKTVPLRNRSSEELAARSREILNDQEILDLVEKSSSATAVVDIVLDITGDNKKAKAARCLFFLRKRHSQEELKKLFSVLNLQEKEGRS